MRKITVSCETQITSPDYNVFPNFSDGSENSLNLNDSQHTLADIQTDNVPSMPVMKDEESILHEPSLNTSPESLQQERDDNQNNMNNRMVSGLTATGLACDRVRVNLKQLLALYAKLKRQLVEFTETKANEQSSYKAKCDEMSSQVSEPTQLIGMFYNRLCFFS